MKQKENNSYIMNDLHAMDALHEHIAMVLYCTNSSAKSISMAPFYTVNRRYKKYYNMHSNAIPGKWRLEMNL